MSNALSKQVPAEDLWLSTGGGLPPESLNFLILSKEPDYAINSSFKIASAAQTVIGLAGLSAAFFHQLQTGVKQIVSVDARHAVLEFRSEASFVATWNEFRKQYGSPGAAGMFGIFEEAVSFEMNANADPTLSIASLCLLFNCLTESGLILTDSIQAMIFLAAIPDSWDGLAMTVLAQYNAQDLTVNAIAPTIMDEYSCRVAKKNSESSLAARLSGVKCYGDHNP
ncbi:hypothetical protein J3R30DRAFT_3854922 [Lentinula aciculospora]|uniref:Uncharacterized protein n=1 Tax=Lentinula aciculospora TaxID=153920 RepID=A0A9W9AI97_9AGAR|nr:hypothetical protein J3R30DRAFT_3854922 [Lentinula aciculospora]